MYKLQCTLYTSHSNQLGFLVAVNCRYRECAFGNSRTLPNVGTPGYDPDRTRPNLGIPGQNPDKIPLQVTGNKCIQKLYLVMAREACSYG